MQQIPRHPVKLDAPQAPTRKHSTFPQVRHVYRASAVNDGGSGEFATASVSVTPLPPGRAYELSVRQMEPPAPADSVPSTIAGPSTTPVDFLPRRSRPSSQLAKVVMRKLITMKTTATTMKLGTTLA
jgi:hypothetical protein